MSAPSPVQHENADQGYSELGCVIVHYRSPSTIRHTVADLSKHLPPARLLIIDNSRDLEDPEIGLRSTIVDPGDNLGYAAAVNLGVSTLMADRAVKRVLVATHETRFSDACLEGLLKTSREASGPTIVAPVLTTPGAHGDSSLWSSGGTMSFWGYPRHLRTLPSENREVLWVDGAAYIVDRAAWTKAGPVPEEFFLYMEDVALGYRARARGVATIVTPSSRVEQSPNGPSRALAVRNRLILARRYMGRWERARALAEFWSRTAALLLVRPAAGRENVTQWRNASSAIRSIAAAKEPSRPL